MLYCGYYYNTTQIVDFINRNIAWREQNRFDHYTIKNAMIYRIQVIEAISRTILLKNTISLKRLCHEMFIV